MRHAPSRLPALATAAVLAGALIAPSAQATVMSGTSDSAALINARSAVLEQQLRKAGLQSQRDQLAAALYYTFAGVQ